MIMVTTYIQLRVIFLPSRVENLQEYLLQVNVLLIEFETYSNRRAKYIHTENWKTETPVNNTAISNCKQPSEILHPTLWGRPQ